MPTKKEKKIALFKRGDLVCKLDGTFPGKIVDTSTNNTLHTHYTEYTVKMEDRNSPIFFFEYLLKLRNE